MVEFRLLGPVDVQAGGLRIELGQPLQRVVLAALLVDAGRVVPLDTLVDRVWGEAPPNTARHTLYSHIARVRRTLTEVNAADAMPVRLVHRSGGYLLDVELGRVDLHRFRRLVAQAHEAGRPDAERAALLREALDLWQGEPLAGLSGDWAARTREAWSQQRLDTVVAWAHAELDIGNPRAVIGPLTDLAGEHPTAESVTASLMRALHAVGRSADALQRYQLIRQRLVDELGADPGVELQAAHQAILRGEPPEPVPARAVRPTPMIPAQLPADVYAFTGRDAELAALDALLAGSGTGNGGPTTAVISAVSGTAGVGKTALAVRWAHRAGGRFPDGQLYVNLRGYDPDQPMTAAHALAGFLDALGVAGPDIPQALDDRAACYRTRIAGRRMLVVLDNASSVEQVRPLLPGSGSSAVIVTSRDSLSGLVAVNGARRLDLDLLPAADALVLLRLLIGSRVDDDPVAATTLVDQCARLPLALRVAAELAVSRPTSTLAELVADLSDQRKRLDLLNAGGDARAAVAAVFSWSVRHLPPDAARTFRLLGLHPGPDFDAYAAAALADCSLAHARHTLDLLTRAHLVHPAGAGRYGMHDLLRAYAISLTTAGDASALARLLDHYLATAAAAMDLLHPAEAHRRPRFPPPATPTPTLAGPDAARAWLDTALPSLVAGAAYTAAHGWPVYTVRLSTTLFRYLLGVHYTDALAIHDHARAAARATGDRAGEAQALNGIAAAHGQMGRYGPAIDHFRQALELFRQTGNRSGEARVLANLGLIESSLGHYGSAAEHYQQALTLHRRAGEQVGQTRTLTSLGIIEERLGRYESAADHHEQALTQFRQAGDRAGEAYATNNLGEVEQRMGRYESAADHHRQALALYRQMGNRTGEAWALNNLGDAHTRLGRPDLAVEYIEQALSLFRELGDHDGEAWAYNGLGEAAHAGDDPAAAITHHTAANTIAADTGARDQQARAHTGLGRAHRARGDLDRARLHYERALTLYTDLGTRDADHVRAYLAELDQT